MVNKLLSRYIGIPNTALHIPPTGPAAGGDGISDGRILQIQGEFRQCCSISEDPKSKFQGDVASLKENGTLPQLWAVLCITSRPIREKKKLDLEKELSDEFDKRVYILDESWLVSLLSTKDYYDLAVMYLESPEEYGTTQTSIQEKPIIFIPHPYPEAPNFTGRKKERAMLTEWLLEDREHPLLSMVAIGGMGKSALAWRWLQEDVVGEGVDLDGVVWWSFYEKGMTFDSFLRSFVASRWGMDSPMLGWAMSDLYNTVYQEFQQNRYLIILDGVERILKAYYGLGSPYQKDDDNTLKTEKDYRTCIDPNAGLFLAKLANNINQSRTFMTTRLQPKDLDTVAGCYRINLEKMEPEDAVVFFHQQGVKGTRAEIERECKKYGYHPLSLRLLSGLIVGEPGCSGDIKDCELLERIKDMPAREHNILEIAYNALDDLKKEFVSSLAAFRAPMEYVAIKAISKFDTERELRQALGEVVNRGILFQRKEKDKKGKEKTIYDLHPIVRSYWYDRLRDKRGVHSQLRDYFVTVPEPEKIESINDLQPVIELYHHTVRAGRNDEALLLFRERLDDYLFYYLGNIDFGLILLKEFQQKKFQENSNNSLLLNYLGGYYFTSGETKEALKMFKESMEFSKLNNDIPNMIYSHVNLGILNNFIRSFDLANEFYNICITLCRDNNVVLSEAGALQYRGYNFLCLKNYNDAEKDFLLAINKYNELINSSIYNQRILDYAKMRIVFTKSFLSSLYYFQCNYVDAINVIKEVVVSNKKDKRVLVWINRIFGASYIMLGILNKAETQLQSAIKECRKINLVEDEANIMLELAKLRHLQSRDDESIKLATEALEIANRCSYVLQQADIEQFLGEFYLDQGDMEKARKYLEDCIEHCTHCWRYSEGEPDFDYVRKEDDFYYLKKEEEWWYRARWEKAVGLMDKLEGGI